MKALVDTTPPDRLQTRLTAIEQAVTALNDRIFKDIQPLNVTLKDKETVEKLEAAYQAIGEKDRKHITGYDDVLYARKVIDGLLAGRVEADVFATIFGSDTRYTVPGVTPDGQSYTVAFTGHGPSPIPPSPSPWACPSPRRTPRPSAGCRPTR